MLKDISFLHMVEQLTARNRNVIIVGSEKSQEKRRIMLLKYISGPLIGAIIGYCTNYIAVKMLFFPKKEIYVFGKKLPFTPGAIPKGKPRLAKAIGEIVGKTLVTEADVKEKLLSSEIEEKIVNSIMEGFSTEIHQEIMQISGCSEEVYATVREKILDSIYGQIQNCLENIEIGAIIAEEGTRIIKEKTAGTMLQMFLNEDFISSITAPVGAGIQEYILENGERLIKPELDSKVESLETHSVAELLQTVDVEEDKLRKTISNSYQKLVQEGMRGIFEQLNLSDMIEEKVNAMSIDELEKLVLTVMKKELDTIVNLGALIGFVLGLVNIVF